MKKSFYFYTLILLGLAVIGCSNSEPPKCSDEATFALVKQIVISKIGEAEWITAKEINDNLKVEYARASAYDEKIKKYSCSAKLVAGGAVELPIEYESQLDDKKAHVVALGGITVSDLRAIAYTIAEGIKSKRLSGVSKEIQPSADKAAAANIERPIAAPTAVRESDKPLAETAINWAPSFDCAKVSNGAERLICSSKELSAADVKLSQVYKKALAEYPYDKSGFKSEGQDWLKNVRNACSDVTCMLNAYQQRINKLSN